MNDIGQFYCISLPISVAKVYKHVEKYMAFIYLLKTHFIKQWAKVSLFPIIRAIILLDLMVYPNFRLFYPLNRIYCDNKMTLYMVSDNLILFIYLLPMKLFLATACGLLLLTIGCATTNSKPDSQNDKITKLVYQYDDASVPPEDHRSYLISIDSEQIHLVVDSYGHILKDTTMKFDTDRFEKLINLYDQSKLHYCSTIKESDGCTGGNGDQMHSYFKDKTLFSASVYHCGGEDYGNLCGNYDLIKDEIRSLIPNLNELLE
jgi:hypothetical protein